MADRRASSLLSLVASRALAPGGVQPSAEQQRQLEAKRQAEEQQMMYAVRMTYLATDEGSHGPDTLFLTRKRAQKLAHHQDSIKMPVRRLDASAQLQSPPRKSNPSNSLATAVGAGAMAAAGLATKKSRGFTDDAAGRQLTWEPQFQAGCHFWQCVETGECRVDAPPDAHGGRSQQYGRPSVDQSEDDEDLPFPESFAFLGHKSA
jgi:hypothetical protein